MNFKITDTWLKEFVNTSADPQKIQEVISLSGPNVETVEKVDQDSVYEIEVTANRSDAASVFGFALECHAILPRYDIDAELIQNPLDKNLSDLQLGSESPELHIEDTTGGLIPRVTALVVQGISVGPSPTILQNRLKAIGERSINNVVDITNYVRAELGQPLHVFDYDKIAGASMTIQKSSEGDVVELLDGTKATLPGGDIIIKDAEGRIVDLVGIMGGGNSHVTDDTKKIIIFIPSVDKNTVRRTSMKTSIRSEAVSLFEKGLDPARHDATLYRALKLIEEHAHGSVTATLIDIYPQKSEPTEIEIALPYIQSLMSVECTVEDIKSYITPLGFSITAQSEASCVVTVPTYRSTDVTNQADVAEEVARIYGYQNIPSKIQQTDVVYQPIDERNLTYVKDTVRALLAHAGWYEQYNYSMISEDQIALGGLELKDHIRISNSISQEIEYMRTSLVPSLIKNVQDNQNTESDISFFECARIYLKQDGDLPNEEERIGMISTLGYSELKGYVESLLNDFKIRNVSYSVDSGHWVSKSVNVKLSINGENIGYIGKLSEEMRVKHGLPTDTAVAELNTKIIAKHMSETEPYTEQNSFATVKLDYTYTSDPEHTFAEIKKKAFEVSKSLVSLSVLDTFENKVTLRLEFNLPDRNITEEEAKRELGEMSLLFN